MIYEKHSCSISFTEVSGQSIVTGGSVSVGCYSNAENKYLATDEIDELEFTFMQ